MARLSPEQNQVATVANRNGWTLKKRGGFHVWSRGGQQVMLAYSKTEGDITALYINGVQKQYDKLSRALEALSAKEG